MFAVFLFIALLESAASFHDSLNFIVPPRATQCFYEDFADAETVKTIDIFVQSGGKNAIEMEISGPLSVSEVRVGDHSSNVIVQKTIDAVRMGQAETDSFLYNFRPDKAGTYAICLDNSNAHIMPKIVQIDIYPAAPEDLAPSKLNGADIAANRIKQSIDRIHKTISGIQLAQHHDRHRQQLHSELNRNSHNGLVYGSMAETIVYIVISIFQIYFVRRWFSTRKLAPAKSTKQWA